MTHSPVTVAARVRGAAVGALTVALATVAHAWASGAAPSGAGVILLGVLAVTVGAIAATAPAATTVPGLLILLAAGQLTGHVLLAASGHRHVASATSDAAMLSAHAAAIVVCAVLVAVAGRLGEALSHAVRAIAARVRSEPPPAADTVAYSADQPLQATLALAVSKSHRGPPVAAH
ncbi:hypothetical protein [Mycolicibacterium arenosum]|uniref:MFS transporter n=1 Tax=Mycolicibacterium arenosum TaxID=2952157 RepID=A0ABT1MB61_9MYCO|nr:hypothetical protein [Mycolicibacterium sp. CAU 1645]MCP9275775.1 hypothetical protein [Mycolicibacterium sp. CAU 1645]